MEKEKVKRYAILLCSLIILIATIGSAFASIPTDDLRAYFPLNETSGTTFDDDGSGTYTAAYEVNSGTVDFLSGSECIDGGNCINVTQGGESNGGSSSGALISSGADNITMMAWVRPSLSGTNWRQIIGQHDNIRMLYDASGNIACTIRDTGGTYHTKTVEAVSTIGDNWAFVVCIWDSTSQTIGTRLNDSTTDFGSSIGSALRTTNFQYAGLGGRAKNSDYRTVALAHVGVYDAVLSDSQIDDFYTTTGGSGVSGGGGGGNASSPSVGADAQYLNYSGVQNRSVCTSTLLNSDSICIRNDNQSLINASSLRMLDVNNREIDFSTGFYQNTQELKYRGSQFFVYDRVGINLPQFGIGLTTVAQVTGIGDTYLSLMTFGARASKIDTYEWRPDMIQMVYDGEVGDTPHHDAEMRTAATSKYSYILQGTWKCQNSGGCNSSNPSHRVTLTHQMSGNINPYEITYETNIDGSGYSGLKSVNNDSASSWMDQDANVELYIACSTTPDNYSISGRTGYLYWNLDYQENITLNCTAVASPEISLIDNLIENPVEFIDNHTVIVSDWFNMFKVPNSAHATSSHKNMTRAIHNAIWYPYYSTVTPYEGRTSYYDVPGTDECYVSANGGYMGHWKWDGFIQAMGMAAACKENTSCYKTIQDNFDCLWEYQQADGMVPQNVRDTYLGNSTYQAPGGWDLVIRWLCNGRVTNTTWCSDAYHQLVNEHAWFRSESDSDADDKFSWGGVPSGWDDSVRFKNSSGFPTVEALDLQGWMILQAESILNLSTTYNTSHSSTYSTYLTNYRTAAQLFYDVSSGNFYDHVQGTDTPVTDEDGYRLTPATGWMMLANVSNSTQTDNIISTWYNSSLLGVDATTDLGILPTLARNHDCFTDGESSTNPSCATSDAFKWNGRIWTPPYVVNYLGAKRMGETAAATYLRDEALELLYLHGIGLESYDSTDGSIPEQGSFAATNFAGFHGGGFAVLDYDWDLEYNTVTPEDTTAPVISNIEAQTSLTQIQVTWLTDEPVNCTLDYGNTTNFGTSLVRTSVSQGCGFVIGGLDQNTTYYFNGTSTDSYGNTASTGLFNTTTEIVYFDPTLAEWEERFNKVNDAYRSGDGFLHWSVGDMYYQEQPNLIEAYLLMFEATGNQTYLEYADNHLTNITARYSTWNLDGNDDFRLAHIAGSLMYFSYEAKNNGNSTFQDRADYYINFTEQNVFSLLEPYVRRFENGGETVYWLTGDSNTSTKPVNQMYGFLVANIYAANVTGNATYYERAQGLANGFVQTMSDESCQYDDSLTCMSTPYRYDFGQDFETFSNTSFGFPPYDDQLNYGVQVLEGFYRAYKHGFIESDVMTKIANTIYYNMYVQEGGLTNILISRDWTYPPLGFSSFHTMDRGHSSMTFHYYDPFVSSIDGLADQLRNDTYAWVHNTDDSFTFFSAAGYPYGNITDPRNDETSVYCSNDDYCRVKPDQVMKHIAASLIQSSNREVFTIQTNTINSAYLNASGVIPNGTIGLFANITLDNNTNTISFEISYPNGTAVNVTPTLSDGLYTYGFSDTENLGTYTFEKAYLGSGIDITSLDVSTNFIVQYAPVIDMLSISPNDLVFGGQARGEVRAYDVDNDTTTYVCNWQTNGNIQEYVNISVASQNVTQLTNDFNGFGVGDTLTFECYATDGLVNSPTSSYSLLINNAPAPGTGGGSGGGGGGSAPPDVNLNDSFEVTPGKVNTFVLITDRSQDEREQEFSTNREIESCVIIPDEDTGEIFNCDVTDNRFTVTTDLTDFLDPFTGVAEGTIRLIATTGESVEVPYKLNILSGVVNDEDGQLLMFKTGTMVVIFIFIVALIFGTRRTKIIKV